MTNLVNVNLEEMRGEDLRVIAKEYKMTGAWKAKKAEMIEFLNGIKATQIQEVEPEVEEQENDNAYNDFVNSLTSTVLMIEAPENHLMLTAPTEIPEEHHEIETPEEHHEVETRHHGRTKKIEVYKDGQLVTTIDGLIETFKWAAENHVANSGWVKHSLKTGLETVAGRKFKVGGYKFVYAQ